ncbi:MAG: DNA polymerase III subunit, partial [Lachnoclostridium sp.]|nr:DNA polymerase III subunit [Lachnoclostridium sp.]
MNGFSEIIGNELIKEHMYKAIQEVKPYHAYILQGETGTGKKSMAVAFSAGLQCTCEEERPCEVCVSCRQIKANCHPDVIWITKEKSGYGVEEIRNQLNKVVYMKPFSSRYKIFLITEAETMTEAAQNALLKTIEEPPEYAVIILMTNNINRLLPTVRSRCMNLEFGPITTSAIEEYLLKHYPISEDLAKTSAIFAQGNLGKAIRYASSGDFIEKK